MREESKSKLKLARCKTGKGQCQPACFSSSSSSYSRSIRTDSWAQLQSMYFCSLHKLLWLLILQFGLWTKSEDRWPPLLFGLHHCALPACVRIAHGIWKAGVWLALLTGFDVPCLYNPITKQVLKPEFSFVIGYFSWFWRTARFLFWRFIIC